MGRIRVSRYSGASPKWLQLFEYKRVPFIYLIHSTRSMRIDRISSFILRQLLDRSGKAGKHVYLESGRYDAGKLKAAHDDLMCELRSLIDEEKGIRKRLHAGDAALVEAASDGRKFRKWRSEQQMDYYIYLTRRCNMACRYCWSEGGKLNETEFPELDRSMIRRIMDFIFRDSPKRDVIRIILFGGEPLILDPDLLEYLLSYGADLCGKHGKRIEYTVDTNGTVWNERIERLVKNYDIFLSVSIDGTRRQHDAFRVRRDGTPTHALVERNAKEMLRAVPNQVGGRAVLGKPEFDLVEAYRFMRGMDFAEIQLKYYCFSGFAGSGRRSTPNPMSSFPLFRKNLAAMVDDSLRRLKRGASSMLDTELRTNMLNRIIGHSRIYRCVLGVTQLVIQTDGKLYPCPQTHSEDYCIGDVDSGIKRWDLLRRFAVKDLYRMKACRRCWAKYACGGCCVAASLACEGGYDKPVAIQCEQAKEEIKAMSYLGAKVSEMEPSIISDLLSGYAPS